MFMDSEKCAHLSVLVASRARPESELELGCSGGVIDVHLVILRQIFETASALAISVRPGLSSTSVR